MFAIVACGALLWSSCHSADPLKDYWASLHDTDADADADGDTDTDTDSDTDTDTDTDAETDTNTNGDAVCCADTDPDCSASWLGCCTQIGQQRECWMEDAVDDGVICPEWDGTPSGYSIPCLYGECDLEEELCKCASDDQCFDGTSRFGRCDLSGGGTVGVCVPLWCNGYKVCSCEGGCEDAEGSVPDVACPTAGDVCCEGSYARFLTDDPTPDTFCGYCDSCI